MTAWVIPASVTSVICLTSWLTFLDSGLRRNDNEAIDADRQPYSLNPCLTVIPAKAGIQEGNDGGPRKLRFNQRLIKAPAGKNLTPALIWPAIPFPSRA